MAETATQAEMCQHLAQALIDSSPYPDLKFEALITREPTGQSVVMRAVFRDEPVAVKLYLEESDFDTEQEMLSAFPSHPNVLQGVHHYVSPRPCIVFPLATDGALVDVIAEHVLAPALASAYASQIASALAHLHLHHIVHLDIKAANVILSKPASAEGAEEAEARTAAEAVVMDFGLAMKNPTAVASSPVGQGTRSYMAPEVLVDSGRPTDLTKIDVYAFGCVLWEMLSGNTPWEQLFRNECDEDQEKWHQRITENVVGGKRPQMDAAWPDSLCRLMQACWADDPDARPAMADVASGEWEREREQEQEREREREREQEEAIKQKKAEERKREREDVKGTYYISWTVTMGMTSGSRIGTTVRILQQDGKAFSGECLQDAIDARRFGMGMSKPEARVMDGYLGTDGTIHWSEYRDSRKRESVSFTGRLTASGNVEGVRFDKSLPGWSRECTVRKL
jgi:serine/threonine protein kinase